MILHHPLGDENLVKAFIVSPDGLVDGINLTSKKRIVCM